MREVTIVVDLGKEIRPGEKKSVRVNIEDGEAECESVRVWM